MNNFCSVKNCNKIVQARGYCSRHLTQIYRYGFVKEYTRRDSNELIFNDKTISIIIRNDDNEN